MARQATAQQPTLEEVQQASDDAQQAMQDPTLDPTLEPPESAPPGDNEGNAIKPVNDGETKQILCDLYASMVTAKQRRKEANESISALREQAVTRGISKKAQQTVEAFMKLNEDDQAFFDAAVAIYRAALGKPVQGSLDLVGWSNG